MQSAEDKIADLEGRLLAHRQLLARLLSIMDDGAREETMTWIAERKVFRDGQEDPGAVPTSIQTLPLSLADEFRVIDDLVGVRLSGTT